MTLITERRRFIQAAGVVAAAATTAGITRPALSQGGGKAMTYQAKPLSLDPKSITGISEKVLVSHYENNYVGAVKRLNTMARPRRATWTSSWKRSAGRTLANCTTPIVEKADGACHWPKVRRIGGMRRIPFIRG